jgi:peptidoglycan hydrolase CwlO-like protein
MSLILKALEKAQKKYTNNAKAVLLSNVEGKGTNADAGTLNRTPIKEKTNPTDKTPKKPFGISLPVINVMLCVVLAVSLASIFILFNDRMTNKMNKTNDQISRIISHLDQENQKISQLAESINKLGMTIDSQNEKVNKNVEDLNSVMSGKIGTLKGDLNNQKSLWDNAINEQRQAVTKNRELVDANKKEIEDLQQQIRLLKDKNSLTNLTP